MRLLNIKQMLMNYSMLQHGFYSASEGMDKFEARHEEFIKNKSSDMSDLHQLIGENGAKEMFRYGRPGNASADQEVFTAGTALGIIAHRCSEGEMHIHDLREDLNDRITKLRSMAQAHFEDDYLMYLLDKHDLEWGSVTAGLKKSLIYEAIGTTMGQQLSDANVGTIDSPIVHQTPNK